MKITRSINEGKLIEFDKESFEKSAYSLINKVIKKLPFSLNFDGINIVRIQKTRSPISFNIDVEILVSGSNIVAKYADDQTGNQVLISYFFYGLPGNTYITEDILKDLLLYNRTTEQDILETILSHISTTDNVDTRRALYKSKEQEIKNTMQLLENKYSVKLHSHIFPDEDDFSQDPDEHYYIYVNVLEINNSLGKFIQQSSGYYEYIINNISYSSFLHYDDHHIISGYGWFQTRVSLAEFSMDDLYEKTEQALIPFLDRVKLLDFIISNEQNIINKVKIQVKKLQDKYPMLNVVLTRPNTPWDPDPINVTIASTSDSWGMTFSLDELIDDASIKQAIAKIQRRLYKTDKSNSSLKSDVKSFIEENIDLLTQDLDEFYEKAKRKYIDLVVLTKVLLQADIPIKYKLTNVPDEIKDMI